MKMYGFENGCMYVCVLEAQSSQPRPSTGKKKKLVRSLFLTRVKYFWWASPVSSSALVDRSDQIFFSVLRYWF